MAQGSRADLMRMYALLFAPLPSPFLTKEEAEAAEKRGERVLRIPTAPTKRKS